MSNTISLKAEQRRRSGTADVRRLRREGLIPAVIYGKGLENVNLKIEERGFTRLMQEQETDNILVDLQIEGESASRLALVQNIQHNPLNGSLLHVDFLAVSDDKEITAMVPLHLEGTPIGVKEGGVLDQLMHTLEVSCVPSRLPGSIEVDISGLAIGDIVHIADLKIEEGVEPVLDGTVIVVQVTTPRVATAEEAAEEAAGTPVVIGAKAGSKDDDEGKSK